MAGAVCIGATEYLDVIKARLDAEFQMLQAEGIRIDIEEAQCGQLNFLGCAIADYGDCHYTAQEIEDIFKNYLANVVADLITDYHEKDLIREIVQENYYYFSEDERNTIYQYAEKYLSQSSEHGGEYMVYQVSRKSKILQRLLEYFHFNDELVVDGFIRFRLKDYVQELQESVERAVDDFMMEREYKEFIRLLKYFVDIQEPRVDQVHVVLSPSGVFKLLDESNQPINSDYLEGFILDLADSEINYEDLLISALITIAPSQIVLHFNEKAKLHNTLGTIENVFGNRVKNCAGCNLCVQSNNSGH